MSVQHSGGCSVQWRANIYEVLYISTVEVAKYSGGLTLVQWRDSIEYSMVDG